MDATIKRGDGLPLGDLAFVQAQIALEFPGVSFHTIPAGPEFLKLLADRGHEVPEVLRELFASTPEKVVCLIGGDGFSLELSLGSSPLVAEVDVRLQGDRVAAGEALQRLGRRTGWSVSYPGAEPKPDPEADRAFYQALAPEVSESKCARPDCERGAIPLSFYCRRHHFEMMKGRPYED
jgi:hypothetical protein